MYIYVCVCVCVYLHFGLIEICKKNNLTLSVSVPPAPPPRKAAQLRAKKDLPQLTMSLVGERERVCKHPASPAVWDAAKWAHFSVTSLRVLNCELHN